jgi:hypothetical protein
MRQTRPTDYIMAAAALLVLADPASGQAARGTLLGAVVSAESGLPVPGALVVVEDGGQAVADGDGVFLIEGLPAASYRIAGVAPGCQVGLGEVEILGGELVRARIALDLSDRAEGMVAAWQDGRVRGEATRSIGALEIRQRQLQSLHEAVRLLAPDMVGSASGQSGSRAAVRGRRSATVEGPGDPLVVVDGVRTSYRPEDVMASLSVDDVDRIDVSMGTAAGWRYGPQGTDGVIEITTRAGVVNALALGPRPEECGFRFPPGS